MTTTASHTPNTPLEGPSTARPQDIPSLLQLANQVFRPAPRQGDMGREYPLLLTPDNAENLCIFRDASRVVSHVGVLRQTIHTRGIDIPAACIGAVCTDPTYRKAGLAGQLLDLAMRRCRDLGDLLMPISGKRTLYVSRGATSIGPQTRFSVPLTIGAATPGAEFTISAYEPACWDELARLQQTEPVRYNWTRRNSIQMESLRGLGGTCLLARRRTGELAASLVLAIGHPTYHVEPGVGRVVQFLGDPRAIPSLLRLIADTGLKELDWTVLTPAQPEVAQTLLNLGAGGKASITGWTILILNLKGLVERIAPLVARTGVELSAENNTLTVAAEGLSVRLDRPDQQVEMLFGEPTIWSETLAQVPAALRIACGAALPIPLPDYGMNYV